MSIYLSSSRDISFNEFFVPILQLMFTNDDIHTFGQVRCIFKWERTRPDRSWSALYVNCSLSAYIENGSNETRDAVYLWW